MRKSIAILALLGTLAWSVDFSQLSTDQLLQMRGTVAPADRAAFRAEIQKRVQSMTPAQRQAFMNQRPGRGQGQGMGRGMNRSSFADFDLNKDGVITEKELLDVRAKKQAARAASGRLMRNAGNAPSFATIDTNKDGKVTPAEFSTFQMNRMQQRRGGGMGQGMGRGQNMTN